MYLNYILFLSTIVLIWILKFSFENILKKFQFVVLFIFRFSREEKEKRFELLKILCKKFSSDIHFRFLKVLVVFDPEVIKK